MSASSLSSLSTPAIGNLYLPASQIPSLVTAGACNVSPLQRGSREGQPFTLTPHRVWLPICSLIKSSQTRNRISRWASE